MGYRLSWFEEFCIGTNLKPKDILMALWAYLDESEAHGRTVFVLGGFVASCEHVKRFDDEWNEVLNTPDFEECLSKTVDGKNWFHMTDFIYHRSKAPQSDQGKYRRLLERLCLCIDRCLESDANNRFFGSVNVIPPANIKAKRSKESYRELYYNAIRTVVFHAAIFNKREPVNFMFSQPEQIKEDTFTDFFGLLAESAEKFDRLKGKLGMVAMANPRDYSQLQAADAIVHELRSRKEYGRSQMNIPLLAEKGDVY